MSEFKIEKPIAGHETIDPFDWDLYLLAQPTEGEDASPTQGKHYKIPLPELQARLVETKDTANNLTTTEPGKVLDARQGKVLDGRIDTEADRLDGRIDDLGGRMDGHEEAEMPHILEDLSTGKSYRFGLRVSVEGYPQMIYEEIV